VYDVRESSKVGNTTEKEQDRGQANNKLYTFNFTSIIHSRTPSIAFGSGSTPCSLITFASIATLGGRWVRSASRSDGFLLGMLFELSVLFDLQPIFLASRIKTSANRHQ
jgi:hypothetical protein